jgi:hypothetical protein
MSVASSLPAALQLAEMHGILVFPCDEEKKPLTLHGFKDATTDLSAIERMWSGHASALIGVPTGSASRYLVVDVDPDGASWYLENQTRLACGRVHRTRRGHHLVYRYPSGATIRNSTGKIAPGVDVRAEGGYAIWWPSHGYEAVGSLEDITEPPAWLLELLQSEAKSYNTKLLYGNGVVNPTNGAIRKGGRNAYLSAEGFRLRRQGATVGQVAQVLGTINDTRCDPPLSAAEVEQIAKGKERVAPEDDGESEWLPPAVVTYGPAFDASKIPLRRWLLGRRRAIGEVTVDAGPPGVNKSMLMLSDAVSIATGRKILADEVQESGAVLLLAGEDARRDVESRLAGILARHNITPAELGDRLHLIYQAEIDGAAYTLARMADDVAALNLRMFEWLRQYPAVLAVFVDPILAWHQLLENSNEAQQILCAALRALAVQGNRHVGFDHHVSKIAQMDVEAHVHNIAALRGAGAIGGNVRWGFTMARLKPETAAAHGIPEEERKRYRRLDPLKASHGADDGDARILQIDSISIANGETVGVLVEVDTARTREEAAERKTQAREEAHTRLVVALTRMLIEKRPRSANGAALWLIANCPEVVRGEKGTTLSAFTLRNRLPSMIGPGLHTTHNHHPAQIVLREPPGEGKACVIDFKQGDISL